MGERDRGHDPVRRRCCSQRDRLASAAFACGLRRCDGCSRRRLRGAANRTPAAGKLRRLAGSAHSRIGRNIRAGHHSGRCRHRRAAPGAILEAGERLFTWLLAAAEVVLGVGVLSGMATQYLMSGRLLVLNHKTLFSLLAFLIIALLLWLSWRTGPRPTSHPFRARRLSAPYPGLPGGKIRSRRFAFICYCSAAKTR